MAQRVEEVWKVAKVGSKRTPSQPVFRSEVQGDKERPQRALLPQIKKQLPKHEARKRLMLPRVLGDREESKQQREG